MYPKTSNILDSTIRSTIYIRDVADGYWPVLPLLWSASSNVNENDDEDRQREEQRRLAITTNLSSQYSFLFLFTFTTTRPTPHTQSPCASLRGKYSSVRN